MKQSFQLLYLSQLIHRTALYSRSFRNLHPPQHIRPCPGRVLRRASRAPAAGCPLSPSAGRYVRRLDSRSPAREKLVTREICRTHSGPMFAHTHETLDASISRWSFIHRWLHFLILISPFMGVKVLRTECYYFSIHI